MTVLDTPESWDDLDDRLWYRSRSPKTGEYRPFIAYRGLPEVYPDFRTGIQRMRGPEEPDPDLRKLERRILDTFGVYAREHLPLNQYSDWDVLFLGQHYRLPTRLLDWTASPYIALFFATEDSAKDDCDGIVWCVERHRACSPLPDALQKLKPSGRFISLEMLREAYPKGLAEFDDAPRAESILIWFEPPSVTPRIVNQYAHFSLMSGVTSSQAEFFTKYPSHHWGVRVPANLKTEIRQRLQIMNITERIIYPGLDGIARWLRSYYSR